MSRTRLATRECHTSDRALEVPGARRGGVKPSPRPSGLGPSRVAGWKDRPPHNPKANQEPDREPTRCGTTALIISDLHLGSDVCQARLLEEFLEWAVEQTRELVINGDIFDDLNFKRLTKRHFACLKVIRRNSDRDDFRLIWVRGNHDGPADIVSHIVGVEILDEYVFRERPDPAPDPPRRPVRPLRQRLRLADRDRLRDVLLHPEVDAAPRRALDPAGLQAMAAQQPARSATGPSTTPGIEGVPLRDLRPHPPARASSRWAASSTQQRHLDRAPPCPFVVGPGRRGPAGILAARDRRAPGRGMASHADGEAPRHAGFPRARRDRELIARDPPDEMPFPFRRPRDPMSTTEVHHAYNDVVATHYDLDPQGVIGRSLDRGIAQMKAEGLLRRQGLQVLDIGMGTGLFLEKLQHAAGGRIVPFGIDLAENMLEVARPTPPGPGGRGRRRLGPRRLLPRAGSSTASARISSPASCPCACWRRQIARKLRAGRLLVAGRRDQGGLSGPPGEGGIEAPPPAQRRRLAQMDETVLNPADEREVAEVMEPMASR